jgi:copper chaperone
MKRALIIVVAVFAIVVMSMMAGASAKTVDIKVNGMTCQDCADKVTKVLHDVKGVEKARVDLKSGIAQITFKEDKLSLTDLEKAITVAGYRTGSSSPAGHPTNCTGHAFQADQAHDCGGCPAAKKQACCPGK